MEERIDLQEALEHWDRVCKVADKEMERPYSKQTEVIIGDLKRAKEYLERNWGGYYHHPLMEFDKLITKETRRTYNA